ncbi:PAS domain-containing protein [uncultured Sphaerotilus sp.]|uniref:PAS domain-containing sensor histidine kinase n=1 Tax=uncultured Sphaerotilus sp. TaxID=474984 RepID=UPI0030CA56CC
MPTPGTPNRQQSRADVWGIVLPYLLVSVLWLGLSDPLVDWLLPGNATLHHLVDTFKDWVFIGATAVALYVLLTRHVERGRRAFDRERAAWRERDDAMRLLQSLVDASPDAIYVKDRSGRYQLFNDAAARLVGRPASQVIGLDDLALFKADQASALRANDRQVMAQGQDLTFEEVLDTVVAGLRTFQALKGPLRDADGQVTGVYGISRDVTERSALARQRQQALEAAHRARDLLHDVLARVGDGLVALDLDWHFTYANPRAVRMLGRQRPDELIGRHAWTEYPVVVGRPFQRACEQAMRDQRPVVREDHHLAWDRWFESRIYPSPQGVSIYLSDITPHRLAERALQVSEQRYRLAASHGQVWDWSADTGHLVVAPEFWLVQGWPVPPPDNSLVQFEARLHPDDLPRFRSALMGHLQRREPYRLEFRMRHLDGSWRWFRTQGQAVWDEQGSAIYMAGTTFDITERKGAEEALRESEAYRRLVFEQLADGVLLIDSTLRVLDANPQALAMLGYTRDELLRRSLHGLLADRDVPRLADERMRLLSGETHLDEWVYQRADGTQFPAEVSVRSLDGRRYVKVLRDISARRASETALLTYQLELSELTQRLLEQEKQTTQRVAQSLHDHVGQTLAVIRLNLEAAHATYGAAMPDGLKQVCTGLVQLLDQVVREVRLVLVDLRPPLLEEQGLVAAIDNEIRSRVLPGVGSEAGADVLIEVSDEVAARRWPVDVEYGVFMVAREAIANARQHAGAGLIRVMLAAGEGSGSDELALDVLDDGHGIPAPMQHGRPGHLGIVGMRERAIAIGARFSVGPGPDGGTLVSLRWKANKA